MKLLGAALILCGAALQCHALLGARRQERAALRELVKGEVLTLETSVSRGVGDKTELVAQLAVPYVQVQERISPRAKQQQAAAAFLDEYPVASVKDIGYFTGVKLGTLRAMERKGLVTLTRQERYRLVDGAPVEPALPPELNEEQQEWLWKYETFNYCGMIDLFDEARPFFCPPQDREQNG